MVSERLSLASRHFLGLQCSSLQPFCLGQERLCAVGAFEQDAEVSKRGENQGGNLERVGFSRFVNLIDLFSTLKTELHHQN